MRSAESELAGRIEDAEAIMLYHFIGLSRPTIESLTRCKLIVRCGVGFDNVDRVAARERGIPVANVPDYGSEEVADSAIGMALALVRDSPLQPTAAPQAGAVDLHAGAAAASAAGAPRWA